MRKHDCLKAVCLFGLLALYGCGGDSGSVSAAGGGTQSVTIPPQNNAVSPVVLTPPAVNDAQLRAAMQQAGVQAVPSPPAPVQARFVLGQMLVFDKILSGNKDVACASCHQTGQSLGDGLSVALGTGAVGSGVNRTLGAGRHFIARNAPSLFNLGGVSPLMWDGRISLQASPAGATLPAGLDSSLAAQALFPLLNRDEMRGAAGDTASDGSPNELALVSDTDFNGAWNAVMQRVLAIPDYVTRFQDAFPGVNQFGIQHLGNAIATFEANQWSRLNSPFDNYVRGDNNALSEAQKRGALVFYGGGRCAVCHRGGLLSDLQFHNVAFPQVGPGNGSEAPLDFGRGSITGLNQDRFRFRTPTLRNVAVTGPWSHSGGYTSLEAVVRHYINPGQALRNYNPNQLAPQFRSQVHVADTLAAGVLNNLDNQVPIPLNNQEVADLLAFLESLTDPNAVPGPPVSVPSGLPVTF
ncbi:MAG: cytochrome c peroxidase [Vulcanimicrobiota bacterium]